MKQPTFSSISEASRSLGVSETALRHWTDEGKIKAFVTPGGHRRYELGELKRFLSTEPKAPAIRELVAEIDSSSKRHREIVKSGEAGSEFDETAARQLAETGRHLHDAIISYVNKPRQREAIMVQAREVGGEFGRTLAALGLPLTDAVTAFIKHRGPIMDAVSRMLQQHDVVSSRVAEAPALVAQVMDETLLALVAAHQAAGQDNPSVEAA